MKEFLFYIYNLRKNLQNQRALRLSFGLQIIGMFLNNLAFFVIWLFFIRAVGVTNGWGVREVFGLLSFSIFTYGLTHTLFGSMNHWSERVINGSFDSLLTKPKNLYLRVLNQDFAVSALGDLAQGLLGLGILIWLVHPTFGQIVLLAAIVPPAVMVEVAFSVITECIIFWFPQAEQLNRAFFDLLMLPSTQPIGLLEGVMRFIYIFVVPALLLGGLPVQAFLKFDLKILALAYAIALGWWLISKLVLARSLKKYESANFFG